MIERVIVYGAGAVGSIVGGHLALANIKVLLVGRQNHVDAIRGHGLKLVMPSGTKTVRLPSATVPAETDFRATDAVLLCVKSQNTEDAMRDLQAVIRDVPVFLLQNGVRNEMIASSYFSRIYGVCVRLGGIFTHDGEVTCPHEPPGWLIMGRYPAGVDDLVQEMAEKFRQADIGVLVTPDVMRYKWGKLVRSLTTVITAITDAPRAEVAPIAEAVQREAKTVLAAAGIDWIRDEQVEKEIPVSNERLRPHASTWQSLARRQGSVETAFLNGEIVRLAHGMACHAPLNEELVRIAEEMAARRELPGKYSPAQLSKLLGL